MVYSEWLQVTGCGSAWRGLKVSDGRDFLKVPLGSLQGPPLP